MYRYTKLFLGLLMGLFILSGCSANNSSSDLPENIPRIIETIESPQTIMYTETQTVEVNLEEESNSVSVQTSKQSNISEEEPSIKSSTDSVNNEQLAANTTAQKIKNDSSQDTKPPILIVPEEKQITQIENEIKKTNETIVKTVELYKDGIYTESAMGRDGPLEVQVEIVSGKIQKVEVLSHQDTKNLALNVFRLMTKEILSSQSAEVSIISGATLTSNGYKEAIKNALSSALIK